MPLDTLLFTVEEVIYIKGLGAVLCPGISRSYSGPQIQIGQSITILRPDGQEIKTTIKGFPDIRRTVYLESQVIVLPKNIEAEKISTASQVWANETFDSPTGRR